MTGTSWWQRAMQVQFVRFVLVGAGTSALYAAVYLAWSDTSSVLANVGASTLSMVTANELHRRLTFRGVHRVDWWRAQWEAGALGVASLLATSTALAGLHNAFGDTSAIVDLCMVGAVSGCIGLIRFFALRSWVFARAA